MTIIQNKLAIAEGPPDTLF